MIENEPAAVVVVCVGDGPLAGSAFLGGGVWAEGAEVRAGSGLHFVPVCSPIATNTHTHNQIDIKRGKYLNDRGQSACIYYQ